MESKVEKKVLTAQCFPKSVNVAAFANKLAVQCRNEWDVFLRDNDLSCPELKSVQKIGMPDAKQIEESINNLLTLLNKDKLQFLTKELGIEVEEKRERYRGGNPALFGSSGGGIDD